MKISFILAVLGIVALLVGYVWVEKRINQKACPKCGFAIAVDSPDRECPRCGAMLVED